LVSIWEPASANVQGAIAAGLPEKAQITGQGKAGTKKAAGKYPAAYRAKKCFRTEIPSHARDDRANRGARRLWSRIFGSIAGTNTGVAGVTHQLQSARDLI